MSLTLQDILLSKKLIEGTSARGAIHAPEMHDVGVLYKKLCKLISDAEEARKAEEEKKAQQTTQKLPSVSEEKSDD